MQISYKNNLDDLLALSEDAISNNKQWAKKKAWSIYYMPLLILTVCSLFAFLMDKPAFYGGGIGGALFSSIWSYFCYKNYPKKMAKEIEQKEVFCEHIISLSPEGVKEKTANSESFNTWESLTRVIYNDDHVFIYNTPVTAHIIPKREVGEQSFQDIKKQIMAYKNT
ncbi:MULTISPECIES: YcxB family protein [Pseudoalteromonas]|uniref:YcxB family protein n=1 Tax=Pseudoalteromonas TaxID=53246 RepID=UPI0006CA0F7B|nr:MULTISPECIES: YcxB family protein [Pseudoalteromonas]KPM74754.1 hypothetical protein AOG26_19340 [Pseudoalteromonas sp. UCD-33C]KPZ68379.1 hypothetical protein AN394_03212 [Pseudoalteromonas sp. P1-26]MDK9683211.1 YcxB family protein [Pseudoalteromonas shioyasakiensis]